MREACVICGRRFWVDGVVACAFDHRFCEACAQAACEAALEAEAEAKAKAEREAKGDKP